MVDDISISVCLPCYEMHGAGLSFLKKALDSVFMQDFENYEIIISDNSVNDDLFEYTTSLKNDKISHIFSNRYFREKKGSGSNLNNAMRHAMGDIIKPLFQDDVFLSKNCLSEIARNYQPNKWYAYPRKQIIGNKVLKKRFPYYHKYTLVGFNRISAPTAVAFPNDDMLFDEHLNWLMDCEFYYRLKERYGEPLVLDDAVVGIVEWGKMESKRISREDKYIDIDYVKLKHSFDVSDKEISLHKKWFDKSD